MSETFKVDNQDVPPVLQAMLNSVEKNGPCILEIGICNHCKHEWWSFHPFHESVPCGHCDKHNASNVQRYLHATEDLADSENGTGGSF